MKKRCPLFINTTQTKISVLINDKVFLKKIISVIPQGYITGPILFNILINDLFLFFVSSASMYNLADNNTLSAFGITVPEIIIFNWFNIMINSRQIPSSHNRQIKNDQSDQTITYDNQIVETTSSFRTLIFN